MKKNISNIVGGILLIASITCFIYAQMLNSERLAFYGVYAFSISSALLVLANLDFTDVKRYNKIGTFYGIIGIIAILIGFIKVVDKSNGFMALGYIMFLINFYFTHLFNKTKNLQNEKIN